MKNDYIKLIKKFILISLPLIAMCLFAYLFPMGYMTTEYVLWTEEKDYVNQWQNDTQILDTLIVGDSRAKSSIIPEELHDSIYNIGIGGSTPIEMYYAVKNFIAVNGAPKRVFIIFAPYHFINMDNWNQTIYNNYLKPAEQAEVVGEAIKTGNKVVCYKGWLTDAVSYRLRLPSKYLAQEYEGRFIKLKEENQKKYDSIRADRGYCEFGTDPGSDAENYEVHCEAFDPLEIVLTYYDKLLSLLTENGVEVRVFQAPFNQSSAEQVAPELLNGYSDYLKGQMKKYPEIIFETEIPVYDNRYFGDGNHLNREGARKYTKELKEKLEEEGFEW